MATRKEREEVDKLLRSMGAQPQMVKQTREAAKGARFRNRAKQMQYQALRELARKRNIGQLKDALSGEAKRLMDEQAAKGAPAKDKRNQLEKDADATRAEFQRDAVKAVRRAQREKPERERKAKAKAQAEARRKAEKQKKARKLAQQDKATMMMERQRKRGEMSRLESRFDASEGKKRVGKSRRLTKRQMELLKGDPKARARLEKMAGKGIVSKGTRRKTGPRQEEDLEAFLNQPSMRKGKPAPARKGKGRKAAPAKTTGDAKRDYRAEAERNTRMAADPKNRGKLRPSERTPRKPTLTRERYLAMSKAAQRKAMNEQAGKDAVDQALLAGVTLTEMALTLGTGGAGLLASIVRRGVIKLAKEAGKAGVKMGTSKVAKEGAARKARQKARDAADIKRKTRNRRARENRRRRKEEAQEQARKEAEEKARKQAEKEAKEKAEREAQDRARKDRRNERARQRRREQREQREREQKQSKSGSGTKGKTGGAKGKTGGRKTGTGSSGGRKTGNTGRQQSSRNKDYKQDWQREKERRGARGGNPRQEAAWRKKAREWTKKANKMTEDELRVIYDRLNLARDRGPSSGHTLEKLKQYIAEAIRDGAPI